ncbi:hypothetical protein MMC31_005096 [Peltigera leucophlebia]|nr:hypothetical protein [Peltigera leucophlebia]
MSSKLQKTIARQQEKIASGAYYEAHQQLRVIASRYVKAGDWGSAIDVLFHGAVSLLREGHGGSGGDLGCYLLEVYGKGEVSPSKDEKARVLMLLRAFPCGEPTKKKFVTQMIAWSCRHGEYPNGDPELHHAAGSVFAEEQEPYEAERHLAFGTKDSPELLANVEYEWYTQDDSHTAALYAARAIFPYLLMSNLRSANKAHLVFTTRLTTNKSSLSVQEVSAPSFETRIYPSLPLLNFLTLLLPAAQRGSADIYKQLVKHYTVHIKELGIWDDALAQIGEIYFGIRIPRQGNPLFEMMGSMMGFGGPRPPEPKIRKAEPSPPAAVDLD